MMLASKDDYKLVEDDGSLYLITPRAQERYEYQDTLAEWAAAEAAADPAKGTAQDVLDAVLRGEMEKRMAELLDWCIEYLIPSREIALYEDNAGGLVLYVTERGEIVYAHEHTGEEEQCAADIAILLTDDEDAPYSWDGHDSELADAWEEVTANSSMIYRHVPKAEGDRIGEYTDRKVLYPGIAGRKVLAALGAVEN